MSSVWFKGHSAADADLAGILEGGSWLQLEDRVTFACLTYQSSSLVLALLLGLPKSPSEHKALISSLASIPPDFLPEPRLEFYHRIPLLSSWQLRPLG